MDVQDGAFKDKGETRQTAPTAQGGHCGIPSPTVILVNVHSLWNQVDKPQGNIKYLAEYRKAFLLAFRETWLKEKEAQSDVETDRIGVPFIDLAVTSKSLGREACLC